MPQEARRGDLTDETENARRCRKCPLGLVHDRTEELAVYDDASGVLTNDDAVTLANLMLTLRRYGKPGGGAALKRHNCTAVSDPRAKALVRSEITILNRPFRRVPFLLQTLLFVPSVLKDLLQFGTL